VLSGSSIDGMDPPPIAAIFRSSVHVDAAGEPIHPPHSFSDPHAPDAKAFLERYVRKVVAAATKGSSSSSSANAHAGPITDTTPQQQPQVRLFKNAAPKASRVRTTRTELAVSAFTARPAHRTEGSVLSVKPVGQARRLIGGKDLSDFDDPALEGISLRMRVLLAGSQSARRAAEKQLAEGAPPAAVAFSSLPLPQASSGASTGGRLDEDDAAALLAASYRDKSVFPLRTALGVGAHHAREALAALALAGGADAAEQLLRPAPPPRRPDGQVNKVLRVSRVTRRSRRSESIALKKEQEKADELTIRMRNKRNSATSPFILPQQPLGDAADSAFAPLDSAAAAADATAAAAQPAPTPVRYRRSWFDLKLAQDGPTRKQVIAERQKELAWAIHRRRVRENAGAVAVAPQQHAAAAAMRSESTQGSGESESDHSPERASLLRVGSVLGEDDVSRQQLEEHSSFGGLSGRSNALAQPHAADVLRLSLAGQVMERNARSNTPHHTQQQQTRMPFARTHRLSR
jgi:hypothetical protein